jgi:hypothetical protein
MLFTVHRGWGADVLLIGHSSWGTDVLLSVVHVRVSPFLIRITVWTFRLHKCTVYCNMRETSGVPKGRAGRPPRAPGGSPKWASKHKKRPRDRFCRAGVSAGCMYAACRPTLFTSYAGGVLLGGGGADRPCCPGCQTRHCVKHEFINCKLQFSKRP